MSLGSGKLTYGIGRSTQQLVFTSETVKYMCGYCQTLWWNKEAGGQLFAAFEDGNIVIHRATGPRATDQRSRRMYVPDREAEQKEILEMAEQGMHFVGDWHTHPEPVPFPSPTDDASIGECVRKSVHQLNGFVLAIVGQKPPPEGWHISVHDGMQRHTLRLA